MTRGGTLKSRTGPERRCIASGARGAPGGMIRFVLSPEGEAVADLAGKLPGRGAWVTADRALVDRAVAKRLFSRAFRAQARAPEDLADRLEAMLAQRLVALIGLARKAGQAVAGFEKVRERLGSGRVGALVAAADGAADGKRKLARLAGDVPVVGVLTGRELGLAFGRDFAIHAALDRGGFADRAIAEALRLEGFRVTAPEGTAEGAPDGDRRGRASASGNARQEGPRSGPGQGDG